MNNAPSVRHRWWQFDLRMLLLLTAMAGLAVGWWRDRQRLLRRLEAQDAMRSAWSAQQLLGPPDTPGAGDLVTAWASRMPDGGDEWIDLEYSRAVLPSAIEIHETYNPGAVAKVSCFTSRGEEVVVWQSPQVGRTAVARRVLTVPVANPFRTRRVKVYIDSANVLGWNEIDAVGLRDGAGQVQWAKRARTSSSFGAPTEANSFPW